MGARHRSPVPDLLFDDVREARVREVQPWLEQPEALGPGAPLHRVTVFLTYRCNLDCPYCKTIARSPEELAEQPQKRVSYRYDDFAALLERVADMPVRHLHFTGGEAALVPGLADMVALCKARGVERVSITSNGTLPPEHYLALVQRGLDEVRVSLDARDAEAGAQLTGRRFAWGKAVETLRALAAARDAGAQVFVLANTVVGLQNRAGLGELVEFILGLGPDDLKLITEVQQLGHLGDFPEAPRERARLLALLARHPPERYPLLRRKLETVFAPDAVGLPGPEGRDFRCYIPLTERTVDGVSYYPCSVYLREGGAPLGALTESMDEQRRKTAAFVRRADCLSDPICRRYCLHCTREYNLAANRARR